jgi:F-type H+-transporting ATPase subunit c
LAPHALAPLSSYLAAGLCMGFGAIGAAVGEGYTAQRALQAIARQPAVSADIQKTMLVGQAVAESASIFALVVAILLLFTPWGAETALQQAALLSAGLCMGLGAIGPGLGAGLPGGAACQGMARTPRVKSQMATTMLVGQGVAQTPSVFALLVSFLLLFGEHTSHEAGLPRIAALLGAGLATGLAAIGTGVGSGIAAASACDATARRPGQSQLLLRSMLVGQAVSQSTSIYALVVSLLLLYVA